MIYLIDESYQHQIKAANLNIIAESNIGDSYLIQANSCSVPYIAEYPDTDLEMLQSFEPFVPETEEIEEN